MRANQFFSLIVAAVLMVMIVVNQAEGKSAKSDSKKSKNQKSRKIASVKDGAYRSEHQASRSFKDSNGIEISIGLLAGVGLQSEGSSFAGSEVTQDVGAAPSLGLNIDVRAFKYLGLEEDAYFQMSGSTADLGGAKDKAQSLGSFTTLKGQYAFTLLGVELTPKAGVGFGYLRRSGTSESLDSTLTSSAMATGVYGMVGLDIQPMRNLTISADYAQSVYARGETKNGTVEQDIEGTKFNRIRVGAYYRLFPRITGGVQFVQRGLNYTLPTLTLGSDSTGSVKLKQLQAVFQYEL